jgi:hypothetical protein
MVDKNLLFNNKSLKKGKEIVKGKNGEEGKETKGVF